MKHVLQQIGPKYIVPQHLSYVCAFRRLIVTGTVAYTGGLTWGFNIPHSSALKEISAIPNSPAEKSTHLTL